MRLETIEKVLRLREIIGVDLQPGIDERADQPSPYCALVVGGIPGAQVAEIPRFVIGLARRQGAQPDRRHQLFMHRGNNRLPMFWVENGVLERDREDLVRSESGIVAILTI